jgi:NADH:ubiquinone oxidoreductase subunit K
MAICIRMVFFDLFRVTLYASIFALFQIAVDAAEPLVV